MSCPLVSICVPIYNVSDYIERCVVSLFSQTYKNIEYIFVDDCSPDDSVAKLKIIISQCIDKDESVRIIRHGVNRGLAAARNTAVANSNGDFILHVDSDDWIEQDAVKLLVDKQIETNADIVSGEAIVHRKNSYDELKPPVFVSKEEMICHMAKMTLDHTIWRRLIRRSLYIDNKICAIEGLDVCEDHYTMPQLIYYANKYVNLEKVVYHYNCMNEKSYTHYNSRNSRVKAIFSSISSMDILLEFFMQKNRICYNKILAIKVTLLFDYMQEFYFSRDCENYDKVARMLYLMGSANLALVGINSRWQRSIKRTYCRYRSYNIVRGFLKL